MKEYADNVAFFNKTIVGIPLRDKGLLSEDELKHLTKCIDEEKTELIEAHENHDFIGAIDASIDLIYFVLGGLYKMGVSPEEIEKCATAVHHCNMTKKRGQKEGRIVGNVGDAVKDTDWIGPEERIAKIIGG